MEYATRRTIQAHAHKYIGCNVEAVFCGFTSTVLAVCKAMTPVTNVDTAVVLLTEFCYYENFVIMILFYIIIIYI